MSKIRFQLDEHMPNAVAQSLRRRGIDVLTASEAGLRSVADTEILDRSLAAGRVVVTQDADYVGMHQEGRHHAGIAYCGQRTRSIGQIIERLILIHEVMAPDDMTDWLEYL